MASSAPTPPLRQVLTERISEILREAESYCDSRAAQVAAEAHDRARRETADRLNQVVRRMRLADGPDELTATLVDAASAYATGVALFRIGNENAKGDRIRGVSDNTVSAFASVNIPLSDAGALAGAAADGEPLVTATTPAEVSAGLVELLGHAPEARAWIFPVTKRDGVAALLYAWGDVEGPPLELLAQVASAVWAGIERAAPANLVSIAPVQPAPASEAASAWDRLSPEEQRIHLRAQRTARVQVAEMRLSHAAEVQTGRARRDLYGALQEPIDAARDSFRKTYFTACPSMVDYLHLELVRTLANDDPELLGKNYPGVMA